VLGADAAGFDLIAAFQAEGREVDAYTIRRADAAGVAAARALVALGADQVTTDDPEGLGAALAEGVAG
jgi:glycerophosphoryl diester phosphodiesterase